MPPTMMSWKRVVAREALEVIDDSRDGINLLMKKTLNVEKDVKEVPAVNNLQKSKVLNFKSVLQSKALDNEMDEFVKPGFSVRKRTVAIKQPESEPLLHVNVNEMDESAQIDGNFNDSRTPEILEEIDETSRKRPIMEEDTMSKRLKLEGHSSSTSKLRRGKDMVKVAYMDDSIGNWASDTDDSRTGTNFSGSLNFSRLSARKQEASVRSEAKIENSSALSEQLSQLIESKKVEQEEEEIPANGYFPVQQLTEERIARREHQIIIGKATEGYKNYRNFHPKTDIQKEEYEKQLKTALTGKHGQRLTIRKDQYSVDVFPTTPRKNEQLSKRQWDVVVRRWRRSLHLYDNVSTKEEFDQITTQKGEKLKVKVVKHKRRASRKGDAPSRNGFNYARKLAQP